MSADTNGQLYEQLQPNKIHKSETVKQHLTAVAEINLNLFRKRRTEHECLPMSSARHRILFNDASDLWLKSHVKHSIGFVKYQVSADTYGYLNMKYCRCLELTVPFIQTSHHDIIRWKNTVTDIWLFILNMRLTELMMTISQLQCLYLIWTVVITNKYDI